MGHEFQNDRPRGVSNLPVGRVPTPVEKRALGTYRGGSPLPLQDIPPIAQAELNALNRRAEFQQLSIPFAATAALALPRSTRIYFLVQNVSPAANLFVAFGSQPQSLTGLLLAPGDVYEPYQVPQNDVWLAGDAAGDAIIVYANG